MSAREQKIQELMESLRSLKRHGVFRSAGSADLPKITPSQWGALLLIEELEESTVKDIAKGLGVTSSGATQLIDGLVASGHVLRETNTKDRRTVLLILSKKTKKQMEQMKKEVLRKFREIFKVLNDKEFDQYLLLNKKIAQRFSKK